MDSKRTNIDIERQTYAAETMHPAGGANFFNRISWGAIIAGTLVALVTMLILNLLGIGVGMGSINPMEEAKPFSGLGMGTIIWWIISNLISIFAGAYVAGKLAGVPLMSTSVMHGILSWCVYTLISFYILTTAVGSLLSGVGSIASSALSATGSGIEAVASGGKDVGQSGLIGIIEKEVNKVLDPSKDSGLVPDSIENIAENTAQEVRQNVSRRQVETIVQDAFFENGRFKDNVTRQDVERAVASNTTLNRKEINDVTDAVYRNYEKAKQAIKQFVEDAKQKAEEKGQQFAEAASSAAIWTFFALVLGGIVAGVGGAVAKPDTVPAVGAETRVRED